MATFGHPVAIQSLGDWELALEFLPSSSKRVYLNMFNWLEFFRKQVLV